MNLRGRAPVADVLVVGGGPAGSTMAGLLSREGWDVLLVDRARFPRPKPCGECLNPGAVRTLGRLGLSGTVERLGPAILRGWEVHTAEGARGRGLFAPEAGPAWAVARERLDAALLEAARHRGARVREGVRVVGVESAGRDGAVTVRARSGDGGELRLRARILVGADGLRSVVARATGAVARDPRLRKLSLTFHLTGRGPPTDTGRLHLSRKGTVGLAPLADGTAEAPLHWNLTVVRPHDAQGAHPGREPFRILEAAVDRAVPEWCGGVGEGGGNVSGPWASGPFDWPADPVPAPGVLLVGDAAGYYDPLTGQGIYRALRSAELATEVADGALRTGRTGRRDLLSYARLHRRDFGPGRRVQRVVETVVGSDLLRGPVVAGLARTPGALDALVRVTGDACPVRSLLHPRLVARALRPARPS